VRQTVAFTVAGRTDVGVIRSGNEDNFLMLPDHGLFIVADGMGGHAAGEVASEMAVQIIGQELQGAAGRPDDEVATRVRGAIVEANNSIFQRTLNEVDKRGMGTTATSMILNGVHYLIGQVGDSRAYLYRDGRLIQLTKDHSYVQEQVDAGFLTPEQARTHPYSNVITRCVGANAEVVPDVYLGTLRAGDFYLLASDGLTGMLEDSDLQAALEQHSEPQATVDALIAEANARGGLDNITVIVLRIDAVRGRTSGETAALAAGA
jgi:protein phosphatase